MAKDSPKTIDEYIAAQPADIQKVLQKIRRLIAKTAPDASEAMAYGIPTFRRKGNLVHFAGFKSHIGFYPSPSGITAFREEIAQYKWAKGSVQFPLDQPIPYDLIERITRFRVREQDGTP
ncbi:MAG: DUF1801 domain-containing protein [Fibrobacterota bacterium]|nr:DUF1801 domain-containing protein [Fibrobacterota bacterium]QQS06601.1 MAG: DUF1801 domain-containing protein [Fibrobacterota bacterium]